MVFSIPEVLFQHQTIKMVNDVTIRDNVKLNECREAIIDALEKYELDNVTVWGLLEELKMDSYMLACAAAGQEE